MLVELLAGLVVGSALLTAATVLLHLPRRRPRRRAPPVGEPRAGTGPVAGRREPTGRRPRQDGTALRSAAADLPVDDDTEPLDVADVALVALVALVVVMALTMPVVGEAVAAVVVPCVVLGLLLAIRALAEGPGRGTGPRRRCGRAGDGGPAPPRAGSRGRGGEVPVIAPGRSTRARSDPRPGPTPGRRQPGSRPGGRASPLTGAARRRRGRRPPGSGRGAARPG